MKNPFKFIANKIQNYFKDETPEEFIFLSKAYPDISPDSSLQVALHKILADHTKRIESLETNISTKQIE
jgi:hypothetical protein